VNIITTLVNGEAVDLINSQDRGLQFGDGLFETMAVRDGAICFLTRHLRRLQQGCNILGIDANMKQISATLQQQAANYEQAVIKLIVTAGNTARGYKRSSDIQPTIIIKVSEMPETDSGRCIKAMICKTRLARQPALAGIKHLNRLEQVLARNEWDDASIQEGLLLDTDDWFIEGTMSNIFLVKDGQLKTPDLTQCGVAGIMRSVVIDLVRDMGLAVNIQQIAEDELKTADEIFMTNSLFEIRSVCEISGIGRYEPGLIANNLQNEISKRATHDTSDNWYR
jgi:4-amino-4-deoxychorismate lyase